MGVEVSRVDEVFLAWGETLRWDDRRQRLYCVDCATHTLHWLDGGVGPLRSLKMPSMPTGMALCEDGRLISALDDGLHIVDVDAATTQLLCKYPDGLGDRANDLNADLDGNLVTGTLNLAEGPGSYWWFSSRAGWRQLDTDIGNANGPVVVEWQGQTTLVFGDTRASRLYAYDYDGAAGTVGTRRTLVDTTEVGGAPDGACGDDAGGVWSCILGPGKVLRVDANGPGTIIDTGVDLPSDVTFGGAALDQMFVVSIASGPDPASSNGGQLLVVDGTGYRGRPEPRFRL